jgi:hypothetical protein
MTRKKDAQQEVMDKLLASHRTSEEELQSIRELEESGKKEEFERAMIALDKKEALQEESGIEGLDLDRFNPTAFQLTGGTSLEDLRETKWAKAGPALVAGALATRQLNCDCLVPFTFSALESINSMSGPDLTDVRNGILGAIHVNPGEYTVSNPGTTSGKYRAHIGGALHLEFTATLPETGSYFLLMPTGNLWVRGHSRVVGHGNWSTSYDAKVWVYLYSLLMVGNTLLEFSRDRIHRDATRSEDRTKYFNNDVFLPQRGLFFSGNEGAQLTLSLRLWVDTAANEDGIAVVVVDDFGFPANVKDDYDTFAVKTN